MIKPYLHVFQSSTHVVPNGQPVAILFNQIVLDTLGVWKPNNPQWSTRYRPNVPGYFRCWGQVAFTPNATGNRSCHFRKNEDRVNGAAPYGADNALADSSRATTPQCSATIFCNGTTDYIMLVSEQNYSGSLTTYYHEFATCSFMIIEWVAPPTTPPAVLEQLSPAEPVIYPAP